MHNHHHGAPESIPHCPSSQQPTHTQQPPYPQQPALPPTPVTFRFSGTKKSILNSAVTDQWGRLVMSVSSTKKESIVTDGERRVVAIVDWDHSSPVMEYHGNKIKVKEWIAYNKKAKHRSFHHNGQHYKWAAGPNDSLCLYPESPTARAIAIGNDPGGVVELEVFPEAQQGGLVIPALLSLVLMICAKHIGDVHEHGLEFGMFMGEAIGAILGN